MWFSEQKLLVLYRGKGLIELVASGCTSNETFPYHEVGLRNWHKRPRVTYAVPDDILQCYLPLVSETFKRLCVQPTAQGKDTIKVHVMGDVGMGFALNEFHKPCMSVEAAALYQIIQDCDEKLEKVEEQQSIPTWLQKLKNDWHHPMSLFMFNESSGWRGCFAEYRLWSALLYRNHQKAQLKTPYAVPIIRSWFPPEVLHDFEQSVGLEFAMMVANTVARMHYDGAPDIVLYRADYPKICFVEVKSASDTLKEDQIKMMQALSEIPNVECQICCPKQAMKRFASVAFSGDSDSD